MVFFIFVGLPSAPGSELGPSRYWWSTHWLNLQLPLSGASYRLHHSHYAGSSNRSSNGRRLDVQASVFGGVLQLIREFGVTALSHACPLSDGWNSPLWRDCGVLLACFWCAPTEVVFGGCGSFRRGLVRHRGLSSPTILVPASAAFRSQFLMGGFSHRAAVGDITVCVACCMRDLPYHVLELCRRIRK